MGLFDKIMGGKNSGIKNAKDDDKPEFKSIIVESENIAREIKAIALAHTIPVNKLDFKILKVKTAVNTGGEEGWVQADDEALKKLKDKDFLLNPNLKIKQMYKVDIFNSDTYEVQDIVPEIALSGNKSLTKVIATIKKDLEVKYFSKLESELIEEINKKKIKAGIFVGIHDDNMYTEVKKIVSILRVNGVLDQDNVFVVCQGIDVVTPVNDDFIYYYKKKNAKEDKEGKIDYSRRGYVLAVSQGECIMEYVKPQEGIAGRNCRGEYLSVKEPEANKKIEIMISENIVQKEDDTKIKYIANKNGYVSEINPNSYDVQDEMEITSIDFKSTGSIETDMSANVTINIKESDSLKDAIGPGMSVEAHELNIEGNIASGAKIKADILSIGGQTHKTSLIHATQAKIAVHRGEITGDVIEVERLEGGKIVGNIVNVKHAIGGEIIASEVTIDNLASNVQITASNKIEIHKLTGNNNKCIIDPKATKEFETEVATITAKIKSVETALRGVPKTLENQKNIIKRSKESIDMVKNKILELRKDGKVAPSALVVKIKEFQNMVNSYNSSLQDYKDNKQKLESLKVDLNELQKKIFKSKIVNHSPWNEYNEIKFKLISPILELSYNTKQHEIIREFMIVEESDGQFKIKRSSEYTS